MKLLGPERRPYSIRSPIDGSILHRDVRPSIVEYKGFSMTIDLPGYYPVGKGEGYHFPEDLIVSDNALYELKKLAGEIENS